MDSVKKKKRKKSISKALPAFRMKHAGRAWSTPASPEARRPALKQNQDPNEEHVHDPTAAFPRLRFLFAFSTQRGFVLLYRGPSGEQEVVPPITASFLPPWPDPTLENDPARPPDALGVLALRTLFNRSAVAWIFVNSPICFPTQILQGGKMSFDTKRSSEHKRKMIIKER